MKTFVVETLMERKRERERESYHVSIPHCISKLVKDLKSGQKEG